jgi:RND family efflux transporter MFP subunit
MHRRDGWFPVALVLCVAAFGCGRRSPAGPPGSGQPGQPALEVLVSLPTVKEVNDYEDFTGRTEAVASVEVRARVTGYLDKVLFKEGSSVKEGERLFEIDPRTYGADLKRTEAVLQQAEAHVKRLQLDYHRAAGLLPTRAISQEDFDKIAGDRDEAAAAVRIAEAARDLAKLNLDFTKVTAPLSGRISRQLVDPGNMVKADETALTTIVSQDPVYAYFDSDERTTLRVRRLIRAGKMKSSRETEMPVLVGLVDEVDADGAPQFPHTGTIDFVDNRVDAMTGTLRLRGVVPNPDNLLSPGLFVRVRVPIGEPHPAVLVPEQALGSDQGQKFVYVVNDQSEAEYRRVTVGLLQGSLRVIDDGLKAGERVVVSGLQRVRPGVKVQAKPAAEADKADKGAPAKSDKKP